MQRYEEFELREELGRGASATIYLAHDPKTQEPLSLKIFHANLSTSPQFAQRIRREFDVVASLSHENIVRVRGLLSTSNPPALVMDYVDGENLEVFQSRLPYTLPEVSVLIVIEILRALEYAHNGEIIHRDLKPENVLISKKGRVFVTDFGLAKLQDSTMITQPQAILGSAEYMSPEQAVGELLTPVSDLFAVASILYFLTTGTRPFSRSTSLGTLQAIREDLAEAPDRRNPKISGDLSRMIQKGLSKNPAARFQSAGEFREALSAYLKGIGLGPEIFSLPIWIADPSAATMDALRTSVERLTRDAEQASKTRQKHRCLELLAHLSLKAPQSPVISRLMGTMKAPPPPQTARHNYAVTAGVGVAAFLAGALIFGNWTSAPKKTPAPVSTAATLAPSASEAPAPATPVSTLPATPRPAPVDRSGEVHFNVDEGVEVIWDGKAVNASVPLRRVVPGEHKLVLRREGYPDIKTRIEVLKGEPTVINAR